MPNPNDDAVAEKLPVWRPSGGLLALGVFVLAVSFVPFWNGLQLMWWWWLDRPEYSHGILLPLMALFFVWQQRDRFEREAFDGTWWGVAIILFAGVMLLAGKLSSVLTLIQYAYVLTLAGLMVSLVGLKGSRLLVMPIAMLVLMIPLPEFLFQNLTAQLQLLSSELGVAFIRLCGVAVFLEGNVIDLGTYKLEVAEACSGLRYLFPLMTLGFTMAYLYKAPLWKRAIVFLSSIPVTIGMNSLRIGIIGVLVDRWGQAMAEGFLHDFEGWVIFMASAGVLLVEIVVLSKIGRDARPWRAIFGLELPPPTPKDAPRRHWRTSVPFAASCVLVVGLASSVSMLPEREAVIPARRTFVEFPASIDSWIGRRQALEDVYVDTLKLDDYVLADYWQDTALPVNLYVAWYDSQSAGESAHSPRTCIPGGGWRIESLDRRELIHVEVGGEPLRVNRAIIVNGDQKQLVYYWFQQRGRVITNEYAAKWFLLWDSLTKRRTDGALVRLITPVANDAGIAIAEAELGGFAEALVSRLSAYVPG